MTSASLPARILVVEDEAIVAMDIRQRLASMGYDAVGVATTAGSALTLTQRLRPDLVLMDIRLNGPEDGIAAAQQIRERFGLPVVFLTAFAEDSTVDRAIRAEPMGYVLKPFEERELRMAIEMALYKHRAEAQRREYETQLHRARRLESLSVLAGGIARDLNRLLCDIFREVERAEVELPAESLVRLNLREIHKAGQDAARLTRQMREYAGRRRLMIEAVDLSDSVREEAQLFLLLDSRQITLRVHCPSGLPAVRADLGQVRQIIAALLANAVEALGPGQREIALSTGTLECDAAYLAESAFVEPPPPGPFVYLEVADQGCGMDLDTQARIFDPFYTTKTPGRGLGLAAVLGIVRAHHGSIRVASERGRGTTVRVLFPAVGPAGRDTGSAETRPLENP